MRKIKFIELPEKLDSIDMDMLRGGVNNTSEDCNAHCTHCSGSSSNNTTRHEAPLGIC